VSSEHFWIWNGGPESTNPAAFLFVKDRGNEPQITLTDAGQFTISYARPVGRRCAWAVPFFLYLLFVALNDRFQWFNVARLNAEWAWWLILVVGVGGLAGLSWLAFCPRWIEGDFNKGELQYRIGGLRNYCAAIQLSEIDGVFVVKYKQVSTVDSQEFRKVESSGELCKISHMDEFDMWYTVHIALTNNRGTSPFVTGDISVANDFVELLSNVVVVDAVQWLKIE